KIRRWRGRNHAFEDLRPAQSALVVVDLMQAYIAGTPCAASIVAPINRLANALRRRGGLVAWVSPASISEDGGLLTALWGEQRVRDMAFETAAGRPGAVWAEGLARRAEDVTVEKRGASAFFPGKCLLPEVLRARGVYT